MKTQDPLVEYLIDKRKSGHYRAFRDHYRVDDLVASWRNYAAREDRFNRYAEMTSHGPSHLDGVADLVAEFTLPFVKGGCLNDSEMFVLKAMAHLHDIGMYTTYDPHFADPFRIRRIHGYLSREAILREAALLFPGVDDLNAIRLIALLCSYHQGSAALSDGELESRPLKKRMRIPIRHRIHGTEVGKDGTFEQWSLERELSHAHSKGEDLFRLAHVAEEICPFLLGALIKLLDGCNFESSRIGSIEALFRHADRNQSHLERTATIFEQAFEGSASEKRAADEKEFFKTGIFHLIRNLMIEKTMILASDGRLQVVIKPAARFDVLSQAKALIGSLGEMAWGESETQRRLKNIGEMVERYIDRPLETVCEALGLPAEHPSVQEWNVKGVPADVCGDVHYLVARKYILREYSDVRHALVGPKAKSWPYCDVCPNAKSCSLKNREWPLLEKSDGTCSISEYDPGIHTSTLAGSPSFSYKLNLTTPQHQFQRTAEQKLISDHLRGRRRLILTGPDGRGKSALMAAVARDMKGRVPRVFHFSFAKKNDQIPRFIQEFAAFLAARGDFLLSNLIVDEEPSSKHQWALLQILRGGRREHRNQPLLMCLDDLNRLERGEEFFKAVIEWFPCIGCEKAVECKLDVSKRYACEEASCSVLAASTKRPGDRWFKSGPFPIDVLEAPALSNDEIAHLTGDRCSDPQLAAGAAGVWRCYGSEAFVIPIWLKYSRSGWSREYVLRLFEEDIVAWLVSAFSDALGSDRCLNMMRLIGLLNGLIDETELRSVFDVKTKTGEDEVTMLFNRGLIKAENGSLVVGSAAWSEGHRRSRWLDLLGGGRKNVEDLVAYIRSSDRAAANAESHWGELEPYFPGKTLTQVARQ